MPTVDDRTEDYFSAALRRENFAFHGTEDEVARLLALGATRTDVGEDADESWEVMADPEGNEFCVLRSLAP